MVPEDAIRPPGCMHLTIGMMSLDEERLQEVKTYLQSLDLGQILRDTSSKEEDRQIESESQVDSSDAASTTRDSSFALLEPMRIRLEGLGAFTNPEKTRVLYGIPVDHSSRMYPFCTYLKKLFVQKGFMQQENRDLTLHMTVANTIYAKRSKTQYNRLAAKRLDGQPSSPAPQAEGSAGSVKIGSAADKGLEEQQSAKPKKSKSWKGLINTRSLVNSFNGTSPESKAASPFVWAEDVQINRVQICELGAKDATGENASELGKEYKAVCEREIIQQ